MRVTKVDMDLAKGAGAVKAYCGIVLDEMLVIRNIRIVEKGGRLLVCMPSTQTKLRCGTCGSKNAYNARFCNQCGRTLPETQVPQAHHDVAFPISAEMREHVNQEILKVYWGLSQS